MPSLLWINGIAYVQYYVAGKAHKKSLRTKDRPTANKRYKEFSAKHELGLIGLHTERHIPTLQEMFDEYLPFCQSNKSPKTYRGAKQHIDDKLGPFFGGLRAQDLTAKHVEDFVTRLRSWEPVPYHPRTINAHLETLRKVLRRAVEHRDLDRMPCEIRMLKTPDSLPRYAYPDEIKQWMGQMDLSHRIRAIVSLMTGISDRDLGYVRKSGIDLHNALVRYRRPKTTTDIVIPVTRTACKLLGHLVTSSPGPALFPAASAKKAFSLASERAALSGGRKITPHMLRHSFGTWLVSIGTPLEFIQQMMGHKDPKTTMRYARVMPEHLREAIDRLEEKMIDVDALMALPQLPDRRTTGRRWTEEQRQAQTERMRGNRLRLKSAGSGAKLSKTATKPLPAGKNYKKARGKQG